MERATGTFLVTHADAESAVLRDVEAGRVHALAEHPDLAAGEVVDAELTADDLGVTWRVSTLLDRREIPVTASDADPSAAAREAVAGADPGAVARLDREWGELHAIAVPVADTDAAVQDVLGDEATLVRAAATDATRVEVRGARGVLAVRYRD